MIDTSKIKRGDRITFISPTAHSGAPKLTRVVKAVLPISGHIEVNAHGWTNFRVRPHEVIEHHPKGEKK